MKTLLLLQLAFSVHIIWAAKCPRGYEEVPGSFCGGFAGLRCPRKDQICQLENIPGGADMGGVCCKQKRGCPDGYKEIPDSFCGGIAALQCPQRDQICQLDNIPGGADMGGVCCKRKGGTTNVCRLPVVTGPCRGSFRKWYFNYKEGKCETFTYGGCQGNENRFDTRDACERRCSSNLDSTDTCKQPADPGPCEALIPQWFYNSKKHVCERFDYGGCQGNRNRFDSKVECSRRCGKGKDSGDVCTLKADPGPCEAAIRRWYYDQQRKSCRRFTFGGCAGNKNNFKTKRACRRACRKSSGSQDVCSLSADPGPCDADMPRWYFDRKAQRCLKFSYGGCDGNRNRFKTQRACRRRCARGVSNACSLNKEVGPCRARIPRWYYNSRSRRCQKFFFGGCRGNANNFRSKRACQRKCRR